MTSEIDSGNPEALIFWNYGKKTEGTFVNKGYTLQFNPDMIETGVNTLSMGLWDDRQLYQFAQFHFHWGSNNRHVAHVQLRFGGFRIFKVSLSQNCW